MNKAELAARLGVSLPTMSALIQRHSDIPVERRGTNGTPWQFDVAKVVTFFQAKRAEEAASKAARDDELAQLMLPLEQDSDDAPKALTIKDLLDRQKLADMRRAADLAAGRLVVARDIEAAYATIFATWNRALHDFIRQLAREHQWPDDVQRAIESRLGEIQNRLVDEAPAALEEDDDRQRRLA